jgi:ammonium transporter Rh
LYLHGLPGILGGLAALFVVSGINPTSQLSGIGITITIALVAGLISGRIISLLGTVNIPYDDSEELAVED